MGVLCIHKNIDKRLLSNVNKLLNVFYELFDIVY